MASAFSCPTVDVGARVASVEVNGSSRKTLAQVRPQGVPRGNSSPDIIFNVKDFNFSCAWLEQ